MNTGRPHIEMLSQRIFDELQQELQGPELMAATDRLIEAQQECWRLICDHLEDEIRAALLSGGGAATPSLNRRLHQLSTHLAQVLSHRPPSGELGGKSTGDEVLPGVSAIVSVNRGNVASKFLEQMESRGELDQHKQRAATGCWQWCVSPCAAFFDRK